MQDNGRKKRKDDYVHAEDLALKSAAQFFGEELLPFCGIKQRVAFVAPTEIIHLEARQMYEDFNYALQDGSWYHLEFESDNITVEDLKRFREYEAATSRGYHVDVVTCVICSSPKKNQIYRLKTGINVFKVKIIRLKDRDSDSIFKKLEKTRKENIRKRDLFPVLLSPLMSGKTGVKERILKGFQLLRTPYENISEEELKRMQAVLYTLAVKVLGESELEEIKEVVAMTKLGEMLYNDGVIKGIERGIEQGIEQGSSRINELNRRLLNDGRQEDIVRSLQIPEYQEELLKEYGL